MFRETEVREREERVLVLLVAGSRGSSDDEILTSDEILRWCYTFSWVTNPASSDLYDPPAGLRGSLVG